ncbi:MAG: hypothetical protein E6I87_07775 [Chloroflexi bacterium]|nr:MAG: hypothetical protein E6I87_07775 [Chloroflexota bacterium]
MAEERRVVTVLFADVAGSTDLGESLDPEDVRALLSRFYDIAKDVIASHGGTIEKFIGDAVMAVFGLPLAHGDDAERAVSAALELRDRVRNDGKLGDRLPVRIGVNTGEVVATRDSSAGDFLVTGDAVNVAARLQQAAEPWQVLAGERTQRAARDSFGFGPASTVAAKGKRAGAVASLVLGRLARRRAHIPLVGRDADLAQVELTAKRAFSERRPQLISIIAPAGTGKTRLLEEFLERLPSHAPDATVAIAQCLPYGQRLTYWPLRAVLFRMVGIAERASPAEVRHSVRAWLRGPDGPDRERTAEFLAATVGAGEGEVTDRVALQSAWREAFEHAARRGPLVVVFEDLHWSSDSLLDLVEFVMQPRGDLPVLMLALTRPELLDRRPSWGGGRRNYVALALEPLADDAVARLVTHLLESSSPEIVSRVVSRAEGNPFFAGELVRALLDRVSTLHDASEVERALASLPDTVQATVLARLDLLQPEERRVLQLGAVLGRSFRTAGVIALDPALSDVSSYIDMLLDKDLIRSSGSDAYVFRHILIREVAYQILPRSERARLHAAAGNWFEIFASGREDAFAELIAYHYREAAALTREDEGDPSALRRTAVRWLRRAGELALAAAADLEAARHLQAAIDLAGTELLPELYERLGDAYGFDDRAMEAYLRALVLCREGALSANRELSVLGAAHMVRLRFQGALATRPSEDEIAAQRVRGRALAAHATDDRVIARFLVADAFFTFWILPFRQATEAELVDCEESARRGLALAERVNDERLISAALDAAGSLESQRGDLTASRESARRRLRMRDLPLTERLDAFAMDAWMSTWLGELDEAIRTARDGLANVQPGQVPAWALHVAAWLAHALYLRGRWDDALLAGDRAVVLWTEAGSSAAGYAEGGLFAVLRAARGRRDQARADRFREVVEAIAAKFPAGSSSHNYLALAAEDMGAMAAALRTRPYPNFVGHATSVLCDLGQLPSVEDLRTVKREIGSRMRVLPVHLAAELDRAIGLASNDAQALCRAEAAFAQAGMEPFIARVRYELGSLTGDPRMVDAGARMLEHIGDVGQLERYERRRA